VWLRRAKLASAGEEPDGLGRIRSAAVSVSVVVVTLNAAEWVERCLASVAGHQTVVVDHGSTDGTIELVGSRFPDVRVVEQENRGLAAGWNAGVAATAASYVLLLNADAWAVGDAVERLVAFADEHPRAAVVGPRLSNVDGTLQRSARGFPTLWRLATEYWFLRKLAPRSRALNAFYAGGFDHDRVRECEWLMGACLLVRRAAIDEVGPADENFFLFSEETDWCYRFRAAGWNVLFYPGAEVVHVGGATHGGRLLRENLRSHLRFLAKHRGRREAERARLLLLTALRVRGVFFRGERGGQYRDAARWLAGGSVASLLG
jgi:N-acetylglucosaminyl-diphospho-decaprenol L-rhamnosyltransferase